MLADKVESAHSVDYQGKNFEKATEMQRQQRRRRLLLCLLLLIAGGSLLGVYRLSRSPLFDQYGIVRAAVEANAKQNQNQPATRTILLWSSFFGDPRWKLDDDSLGPSQFRDDMHCPVYQCELSNNHDFLPSLDLYDAIVFHVAEPFPILRSLPSRRSSHQAYVFALMEPPGETKHRLSDEQGFYNLTMTYRLDSDIVWPYAHLIDMETGAVAAPSSEPHWREPPAAWNDSSIWQLWPKKSKMAAWFVSHCETLSKREQLAETLQQHIEVDIYGKCGTLSCPRGSPKCDTMLDTDYKFYFAFENSLCTDYVTEKLYMAMERNILPVVYGGANYSRFLPPRSYIDADQFESAAALAEHLRFVASDVREYMRYFWWRPHYRLGHLSPFCELCAQLHSASFGHKSQIYGDIESWWLNSCRFEPHIRF